MFKNFFDECFWREGPGPDATDSICPKGWEMARYDGNGSWDYLLAKNYGKNIVGNLSGTTEADNGIVHYPISLLRSGTFNYSTGMPYNRNSYGGYWVSHLYEGREDITQAFYFYSTLFRTQGNTDKGGGRIVRCVAKCGDATDSICPKGWEMARESGERSWTNLFQNVFSKLNINSASNVLAIINPVSNNYSGNYSPSTGKSAESGTASYIWLNKKFGIDSGRANALVFSSITFYSNGHGVSGSGYSLRCVAKIHADLDFERFAGGNGAGLDG